MFNVIVNCRSHIDGSRDPGDPHQVEKSHRASHSWIRSTHLSHILSGKASNQSFKPSGIRIGAPTGKASPTDKKPYVPATCQTPPLLFVSAPCAPTSRARHCKPLSHAPHKVPREHPTLEYQSRLLEYLGSVHYFFNLKD